MAGKKIVKIYYLVVAIKFTSAETQNANISAGDKVFKAPHICIDIQRKQMEKIVKIVINSLFLN